MTSIDLRTRRRGTVTPRSVRSRRDGEAGQALTEYVAVIGVLLLVVGVVFAAATPVAADVSEQLLCAVDPIVKEDGAQACGEPDGGSEGPGGEDNPGDGYEPPSGDCEQDVTFDSVDNPDSESDTSVVQIDCVWYPGPSSCFADNLPEGHADRSAGDRVYLETEIQDFVDCVLDGQGGPKDDPNDESCVNAMPTSGELDEDAPPKVQVGCRELPVPKGCEKEWKAYEDAAPGKDRAARSGELANCITTKYTSMEPPCVIEATGHVESENVQFLFFRWGDSNGTLIEKLGDGRIRIHILSGVEMGAGVSGSDVGGTPVAFDIAGITGYAKDKTYEFTDMQKAQDWIDWYKKYDEVNGKQNTCSAARQNWTGGCGRNPYFEQAEELRGQEPDHHELAEADSSIKRVKLKGGLKWGPQTGATALKGAVEGGYEGEVQVEDRRWSDGSRQATYTSSDIGGFLIGAELSGKQPFTKNSNGAGKGKGQVGAEWKGTTSTSVVWNKDGELSRLIIAMDDQVMRTLYKAGVDVDVVLPYGFKVTGGYSSQGEEGTLSKRELIIDFNQYPELREKLGPKIDEVFPRDREGNLIKGDVEINGQDGEGGELYEAAEDHANVRKLTYDMDRVTGSGGFGLKWQGLDLFKVDFTTVDENRKLSESSFEVTDVDGNRQTTSPAPQCRAKDFEQPEGYYSNDFSDPHTSRADSRHDIGAQYVDNETPQYTEGTYPGTDYSGDVPGDRADRVRSLLDEYGKAFPDKNILVVKDFEKFSFSNLFGFVHLATVDGMDVIAMNSGTVKNKGDGGWINWGFSGSYDYDPETKIVKFKQK
ncbi:hypothetical protein [Promicromonospora iranensis]|uniref:Uncharacterized protein n=1 Tax=Promicromonospora iranensis TaxID=1105144 RepID=A0ABU2CJZ0_9MICO|nr:hypothetical protein [Promicromonospora iranensis]MDR7381664.1 hypothetical protein [Promicromonospora iranensis]